MSWFKKRPYVIERLWVRPGETLIVKAKHPLTFDEACAIKEHVLRAIPDGVKVLVVEDLDLAVIRRSDG